MYEPVRERRLKQEALLKQIKQMKQKLITKYGSHIREKWENRFPNGRQVN